MFGYNSQGVNFLFYCFWKIWGYTIYKVYYSENVDDDSIRCFY